VLTRLGGSPRQVFVATGQRLRHAGVITISGAAYARAREDVTRDLTPDLGQHPTLQRIADELAARIGLADGRSAELLRAELDVEAQVCRAVPGAPARIGRRRGETGRGVVFISDTSLPPDFLERLLVRESLFIEGDRLFTSADWGASKQEGGLYDIVAAELGVPAADITHVGDDHRSDVVNARLHGWHATRDDRASFTDRERDLDAEAAATDGLGPRLAAASRLGRLRAQDDGVDAVIAAIAGAVALPLYVGFGSWVVRQARRLDLDRLYFVARDGEVFLDVTRRLAEQAGDRIDCRYLYGSRTAWQLASAGLSSPGRRGDLWIPDDGSAETLSARDVLALVSLSPDDAFALAAASSVAAGRADEPLGADGWDQLQALIAGPLADEIGRRAGDRRRLLVRYLDQEGVTAPGRVGVVDVGWTGRAARALEDVLVDAGRPLPSAHLFLGLIDGAATVMGADLHGRSLGWLVDEARGRPSRTLREDPVMVIESFAMGREGHTIGYAADEGRVIPQLAEAHNPAALRWPLDGFRQAVMHSLAAFLDGPVPDDVDLSALVWRQVLAFWRRPSRDEATAWGAQPYGDDFHNAATHPLAKPATAKRVLTRVGIGPQAWREPTFWLAGTVALSPQPWRAVLRVADDIRQLRAQVGRIPAGVRAAWAGRRTGGRAGS
jgi:FMN phosphatase YigB (HAD superfamily)